MNKFFFITSYDQTSSEILTSLINIHPDIECTLLPKNSLLPESTDTTIDKFIEENASKTKKYSGNINSFSTYELQNKMLEERTKNPFRKANILISPLLRIRFILHSWLKSGLSSEQILSNIEKQFTSEIDKKGLFDLYKVSNFYKHILSKSLIDAHIANETYKNNSITKPKNLPDLSTARSRLFLLALSITLAFDSFDISNPGKGFRLETLLSNENEFSKLIEHITHNQLSFTEDLHNQYKSKIQDIFKILSDVQREPIEAWQMELLNTYLGIKLETIYSFHNDKSLSHFYNLAGYQLPTAQQVTYSKLVSIQLNSNRPAQLSAFFDNVEETADHPQNIEIVVNIDNDDEGMRLLLNKELLKRKFALKYIQTPRPNSFHDLWKPLNKILEVTDPQAYFLLNISDEQFFATKGWDTILKKYVGFFPDHIFRLRASRNKFRNYFDRWECNFAQDSIPFTTKKWINIVGDWNPCFGPDSFQQLTSFYLAQTGKFSNEQNLRDIPIIDIQFTGDIPAIGISKEKAWKQNSDSIKALQICQSYKMQLEAKRRAMLLKANIFAEAKQFPNVQLIDLKNKKKIQLRVLNRPVVSFSYKLSWLSITLANQWRKIFFYQYFGGGINRPTNPIKTFSHYLVDKHLFFFNIFKKIIKLVNKQKAQQIADDTAAKPVKQN